MMDKEEIVKAEPAARVGTGAQSGLEPVAVKVNKKQRSKKKPGVLHPSINSLTSHHND